MEASIGACCVTLPSEHASGHFIRSLQGEDSRGERESSREVFPSQVPHQRAGLGGARDSEAGNPRPRQCHSPRCGVLVERGHVGRPGLQPAGYLGEQPRSAFPEGGGDVGGIQAADLQNLPGRFQRVNLTR